MRFSLVLKKTTTTLFLLFGGKIPQAHNHWSGPVSAPPDGKAVLPQPPTWPQEWNTKEGSRLPKCHCLLISLVSSDLFTRNNNLLPLPRTTLLASRRVQPQPPREGTRGPGARNGARAARGAVYAAPRPCPPPARPARRRLPPLTSLKLWDFLLLFLSENSMVL